ncbi:MAG: type II secretion system F family protein [Candidatus Pacearchaeota archaeon]|nr:type II secretion system F family protein [Candidatus Pacearchaeota archaeon]
MNEEKILANIQKEKEIVEELLYIANIECSEDEKEFIEEVTNALLQQLKILSASVSTMLKEERKYKRIFTSTGMVFIDERIKKDFIEQLGIERKALKKIKRGREELEELKKPSFFVTFSSLVFRRIASEFLKKNFPNLKENLQKANLPFLPSSYVSIIFLITFFVFVVSLATALALSNHATIARNIIIAIAVSIFTFIFSFYYPSIVASSTKNKIEDELPFAVSHMNAIVSSGVEPSKVFFVMSKVKEYPFFSKEAKKITNQMNIYGYDFTTALKNVAKICASDKLSELLNGIATTTKTGGSLKKYLEEKAKDLLLEYRLKREKYSESVSVISDIYTALLIAAPLMLMLTLAIISMVGSEFAGIKITELAILGMIIISFLNIIFLIFIHITHPKT